MLNPILSFSATRRMRSFRTMLIVIAYEAALLLLALLTMTPFLDGVVTLYSMERGPISYVLLVAAQFGLIALITPAMTSGAIAGERERQTLDLLLVTNTGSFRIATGKILESFALLALLIICGLPVTCLCLLTGGIGLGRILLGTVFLLAEALLCTTVGVFCSSLFRSTVVSAVISYLLMLAIGVLTALPFLTGYPQQITNVVYDHQLYAALTPGGARGMISPFLYMNPAFGLTSLLQGQTHMLTGWIEGRGWGRLLCTWRMMDRAGCDTVTLLSAGGMMVLSAALTAATAFMIRRGGKRKAA